MKYSLQKINLLSRSFNSKFKPNKYKNVSEKLNLSAPVIPEDFSQPETYGRDTVPPQKGQIYPLPVIDSKLVALQQGYYEAFDREPVSAYYSVKVKDKLYHVFNAARIPLGRMCTKIAHILQGKSSPFYRPNRVDYSEKCIVVNAKYTFLTGKKLTQKLYRHHTGFPGGLKAIKAKDYLEKNPREMVWRSIKGMLPKNKMRILFLSKVEILEEGSHNYPNLPQFGKIKPVDYNQVFGTGNLTPENSTIVYNTFDEKDFPEEFKGFKREYDEKINKPGYMTTPKEVEDDRMMTKYLKYTTRHRFLQYRNIRNKAYRYI